MESGKMAKNDLLKILVVVISTIFCLVLLFVVNIHYGIEIVYTHIFYLPIIITGIWFYKKAYWIAGFLGMIHIFTNVFITGDLGFSSLVRAIMFIVVAGVVGTLSLKREILYKELIVREEELRQLNESMLDMISRINSSGAFEYVSPSVKNILGYSVNEILNMTFFQLLHPEDKESVEKEFLDAIKKKESVRMEYRWLHKNGSYVWVESVANPINHGTKILDVYVFGTRDINLRKATEEKLIYLSMHDALTGLYNRGFLNHMFEKKDYVKNIAVFSLDIDDLKYVNDNFGHLEGDKLIIAVSDILKKFFREKDVVSRVGGDEFFVIAPDCDWQIAEMLKQRILGAITQYNATVEEQYLKISISIGYAIEKNEDDNIEELMKQADALMYADKQSKKNSTMAL